MRFIDDDRLGVYDNNKNPLQKPIRYSNGFLVKRDEKPKTTQYLDDNQKYFVYLPVRAIGISEILMVELTDLIADKEKQLLAIEKKQIKVKEITKEIAKEEITEPKGIAE